MKRVLLMVGALALLGHCGDTPEATEIVVLVQADPAVRGRATAIRVFVQGRAGTAGRFDDAETIDLVPGDLNYQFSITPAGGDVGRQWRLQAEALDPGGIFVTQVISGEYLEGESRVVHIFLRGDCIPMACSEGQTCGPEGTCRPVGVRAGDLDVYEGGRVEPFAPRPRCMLPDDCDNDRFCDGVEQCIDGACMPGTPPCAEDVCNDDSDSCECTAEMRVDADMDGTFAPPCGNDCDDNEPSRSPDMVETIGDGIDNDCDGMVDECPPEGCPVECPAELTPERSPEACSDNCDNDGNGFVDCDDYACDGIGGCTECECSGGQACLQRERYGFASECGESCTISAGAALDPLEANRGDCSGGQACWWRGSGPETNGVCAPTAESNINMPNLGQGCNSDGDCFNPFGFGRCLLRDRGASAGFCSIVDCNAPGLPPTGICPRDSRCVPRGVDSYCIRECPDGSCPAGLTCVTPGSPGVSLCMPACTSDPDCGDLGECVDDGSGERFCMPPLGF
ncbi:MAG: hypothetical protein CMN30_31085 [Sandaracinus sp.]|nr:hypothetical protein [Sandaracinus sp.]|tara:strand:- start:1787 stop:3316 length:1530 start_codon:yes stop_codon:yes gene_type:complete